MASEFVYTRRVEFADTDTANLIHFTALLNRSGEREVVARRDWQGIEIPPPLKERLRARRMESSGADKERLE